MKTDHIPEPRQMVPAVGARAERVVGRLVEKRAGLRLTGDENTPPLPMTEAEVNHLRRLLAWMRVEYMLDPHMQQGCVNALEWLTQDGTLTPEQAGAALTERAEKINRVPAYVRQGVKMLTKALRDHESKAGIVDDSKTPNADLSGRTRSA